jgi:hypothetical protein
VKRPLFFVAFAVIGTALFVDFGRDLRRESVAIHNRLFGDPLPAGETTVQAVIDNIYAWDGDVVTIRGWLGKCFDLDCHLFDEKNDAVGTGLERYGRALSIAYTPTFDDVAVHLQFSPVRLRAKVNADGLGWLDRAPVLRPISIAPLSTFAKVKAR